MKQLIKKWGRVLANPETGFLQLQKESLEQTLADYLKLLVLAGIASALATLLLRLVRAVYLDTFLSIQIDYPRMINYGFSQASAMFFFYLFAGSFLFFFLSLILKFPYGKLRYADLLKVMVLSTTPLLLFSWIPFTPFMLLIWSVFLFGVGIRSIKIVSIKKDSIAHRD